MSFRVNTTRFMDFVQLVVSGPASMKGFVDLVKEIEQESLTWADTKILADLRSVEGRLDPSEQVFLGELVAQHLHHLEKVASVVPADQITRNSEAAAQTLGMQLRVFTSREEAIAWLKAKHPDLSPDRGTPSRPMGLHPEGA
jgi:hypothetical protein